MITTCKVQYHYQTLLKDLPQAILNREDMDSILNLALKATARALQVDRGLILMLKDQDSLWQNRSNYSSVKAQAQVVAQWSAHSNTSKSLLEHSFPLTNSPLTRSALKNTPQPLAFAHSPDGLPQQNNMLSIDTPPASLFMPLMGSTGSNSTPPLVLGFLVLQQYEIRQWQEDELELVNWVAIQISTAMIQDRALRRVQSLVDERTG